MTKQEKEAEIKYLQEINRGLKNEVRNLKYEIEDNERRIQDNIATINKLKETTDETT